MADLFLESDFSRWSQNKLSYPGTWQEIGWRFFAVSGSQSTLERVNTPEGVALRLERSSDVGDCGLDRDGEDLRTLLPPRSRVFVRVWARRTKPPGLLDVRLAEFQGNEWTGRDNRNLFKLTDRFEPYRFEAETSEDTTEVSVGLRVAATGALEILRVEMGPVQSAKDTKPRILLPQGRTLNTRPVLWWRGEGHAAYRLQSASDLAFEKSLWDSGRVERGGGHAELPAMQRGEMKFVRVRVQDFEGQWSQWSEPTLIVCDAPEPLASSTLAVYDLQPTRHLPPEQAFEQAHLVAALQGLANRERPRLAVRWIEADNHWLQRLRQSERWLESVTLEECSDLERLLERFSDCFEGVVLWDPSVPATSNVASTIAGVENLLPIPLRDEPGSLYRRLVMEGPKLPIRRSLVGLFTGKGTIPDTGEPSSGSAKNDAYRWAIAQYLESGKCNPARIGYYVDYYWAREPGLGGDCSNHTLTNHDFFIMHRGFFWDLSVWNDETPVDDPDQPLGTDYATLLRLLKAAAERLSPGEMIHCGGFTPWAFKYCQGGKSGGGHHAVQSEWETVRLLSAYNAILDADALALSSLSNASVYWHIPRPVRINQVPPPLPEELYRRGWLADSEGAQVAPKTYVCHYVGDYDSAAWLTSQVPPMWDDFRRGEVVLPWAWNANLMERGMPMFDEYLRTRTPNDCLWSGDNGAGYLAPTQLFAPRPPSGLPPAGKLWRDHCSAWFRRLDLRHVGFIINGRAGELTPEALDCYLDFAGDGVVARETEVNGISLRKHMPVVEMGHNGLTDDPLRSAREIASIAKDEGPRFLTVRSVLREPSYFYRTNRALQRLYPELDPEFLSPAEFFYLLRVHLGGENVRRAAFLYDTLPGRIGAGKRIRGKLWLRNLGWKAWEKEGASAVRVAVELTEKDERANPVPIPLPHRVEPGALVEVEFELDSPAEPGPRLWRVDLVEGETGWFSEAGNLPDARTVEVE
jgi:hypothetical protein